MPAPGQGEHLTAPRLLVLLMVYTKPCSRCWGASGWAEVQSNSALQQDAAHTSVFLLSFFQAVCTSGQAEHPHLQRSLAICLGDYAAWFAR